MGRKQDAGFNYNPLTQKPETLEPMGHRGGYHYYGPPPDAGFSYGLYSDGENLCACIKGEEMYSPLTGQPMELKKTLAFEDVDACVQNGVMADVGNICQSCTSKFITSMNEETISNLDKIYCPACGQDMPEILYSMKMSMGMDTVGTQNNVKGEYGMKREKVAQVFRILGQLKTSVKADFTEQEDMALAQEIEAMDDEQREMLDEEIEKDEELATALSEPELDEDRPSVSEPELDPQAGPGGSESEESDNEMDTAGTPDTPDMSQVSTEIDDNITPTIDKPAPSDDLGLPTSEDVTASLKKIKTIAKKMRKLIKAYDMESEMELAEEIEELEPMEKDMLNVEIENDDELSDAVSESEDESVEEIEEAPLEEMPEYEEASTAVQTIARRMIKMAKATTASVGGQKAVVAAIETLKDADKIAFAKLVNANETLRESLGMEEGDEMMAVEDDEEMGEDLDLGEDMGEELPMEPTEDLEEEVAMEEEDNMQPEIEAEDEMPMEDELGGDEDLESPALEPEEIEEAMDNEGPELSVEPIAAVEDLEEEEITESDVKLEAWNTQGENPFYNVSVMGSPVAQIYLMDQRNPEEIRATFVTDDYRKAVAAACAKVGIKETLKSLGARYFAAVVNKSKLAKAVHKKVKASYKADHKKALASVREDLIHCVSIVLAGANKNFYADMDNSLKAALYEEMVKAGVYNPQNVIEASFDAGADKFFEFVLNKAIDYMDMPKQALAEVAKAIGESATISVESTENGQAPTLGADLAVNSLPVVSTASNHAVDNTRDSLRQRLALGKKY